MRNSIDLDFFFKGGVEIQSDISSFFFVDTRPSSQIKVTKSCFYTEAAIQKAHTHINMHKYWMLYP